MARLQNTETVRMHLTPSTAGTVIGKIEAGTTLNVLRKVNDMWLEVFHNGKQGFIMTSYLQEVREPARKGGGSK